MNEVWRDIAEYQGKYQVSNLGQVRTLNYRNTGKEHILSTSLSREGYVYTNLLKEGKLKKRSIHSLVAQAFIPNTENKPYVDHINTDRTDNRAENLRWVTPKENSKNPITVELRKKVMKGPRKRVICDGVIYDSLSQCARRYNTNRRIMNYWLSGTRKMPVSFQELGLKYYIEEK